jgi:hypothetical protein
MMVLGQVEELQERLMVVQWHGAAASEAALQESATVQLRATGTTVGAFGSGEA